MQKIKYFKASWCGNCRTFEPVFDQMMRDFPDVVVEKVDVDKASDEDLACYHITDLPHIAYKDDSVSDYIVKLNPVRKTIEDFLRSRQS